MKPLYISIGIPAHNEEHNIQQLLHALCDQELTHANIEIVVMSDASSDNTVKNALKIRDPRIRVIDQAKRLGKNATLNKLLRLSHGDIFIQLDADVVPVKANFLKQLIKPILESHADLVAAHVLATEPKTVIEYLTAWGQGFRTVIYRRITNEDNIYLCYGRARAFSKKFYKKLRFPNECPEDSYSYLFLKKINGKFVYQKDAQVYFRSPASIADYIHQSTSFVAGEKALKQFFPTEKVEKAYEIPLTLYIQAFWDCILNDPMRGITAGFGYIALTIVRKLFIHVPNRYTSKYVYLATTKTTSSDNGKIQ
jgi:glycosyltransferase involved in cell wall biosynthesis